MSQGSLHESLPAAEVLARFHEVDRLHTSALCKLVLDHQSVVETNLCGPETYLLVDLARIALCCREDAELARAIKPERST